LSTLLAWVASSLLMIAVSRLFLGWGGSAGGAFSFLAVTAILALAGWLFVFLPLVLLLDPRSGIFKPALFPWVGAAAAVLVFFSSSLWWAGPQVIPRLGLYAAVVGCLTGWAYSLLQRRTVMPA
jgi:hypothetical protein